MVVFWQIGGSTLKPVEQKSGLLLHLLVAELNAPLVTSPLQRHKFERLVNEIIKTDQEGDTAESERDKIGPFGFSDLARGERRRKAAVMRFTFLY